MFRRIIFFSLILALFFIGLTLLYSYTKMFRTMNQLKEEIKAKDEQTIIKINDIRDKLNFYDKFLNQVIVKN